MFTVLENALQEEAIPFKTNSRSTITHCPECQKPWKLWLMKPRDITSPWSNGQCWSCGAKFNSFSLLVENNVEPSRARHLLGLSETITLENLYTFEEFNFVQNIVHTEEPQEIKMPYPTIESNPNHPISKYAFNRGVKTPLSNQVFIDTRGGAAVFPIYYKNEMLIGYQKRYINPIGNKTKTSKDIPLASSVWTIKNPNKPVVLVEGPFDAIAVWHFGYTPICFFGAQPTRIKLKLAVEEYYQSNCDCLYVGFDDDVAGDNAANDAIKILDSFEIPVKRMLPFDSKDFNEQLGKETQENVRVKDNYLLPNFNEFKF
jgi:hypothetical protein